MPTVPPPIQPTLETRRLRLRPFVLADAAAVQRLAGAWEVAETTLLIPHPYPDGAAEQWIATHPSSWLAGDGVTCAITQRATGTLVGAIGLTTDRESNSAELGYWVGVPYWNRGYATEAARAVVQFGFDVLGVRQIHAQHFPRNPASGRVLEKIGMHCDGIERDAIRKWGRLEDIVCYSCARAAD